MSARFEELDWRQTPMGAISLRRRRDPALKVDVYEVKLDDDFLMSSVFTAGEVELARIGLAATAGTGLDVLVGGLGLGYTAHTVLDDPRLRSLTVLDTLAEVIEWHERGLVPLGERLASDERCRLVRADFFTLTTASPEITGRFHAILVDIDHSPRHVLHPSHESLYREDGLRTLAGHLHPGGSFALWSDDPPDARFAEVLSGVFAHVRTHTVDVPNPLYAAPAANTVYVATKAVSA